MEQSNDFSDRCWYKPKGHSRAVQVRTHTAQVVHSPIHYSLPRQGAKHAPSHREALRGLHKGHTHIANASAKFYSISKNPTSITDPGSKRGTNPHQPQPRHATRMYVDELHPSRSWYRPRRDPPRGFGSTKNASKPRPYPEVVRRWCSALRNRIFPT
ncbi:hypothetical protein GALMADRAFT_413800 [Galerina marginata CBS 339.88]|uniref:Uncharacterized protein n=1 Tax=Galerina marginata (strain CBS 339.88) TaxID=685588 RepID=A0A067TD36_GALM3|nr:hypothetical protein GALMADRAFT_413800 [Galerina marginata CBS 339.88]